MHRMVGGIGRFLLRFLGYGTGGAMLVLLAGFLWLNVFQKPDLKPWHTAVLREEFTKSDGSRVRDIDDYRKLEDRLFDELKGSIYRNAGMDGQRLNRYSAGSLADPTGYPENGNRSYELTARAPRAGVLMIHGLGDSPYSLRSLAQELHRRGCWIVGLRLPGHGTAPSALTTVRWEDWAAAVRMAAKHLRQRVGASAPVYFVGFSTGAALSVEYALARQEGEDLPKVDGLVLLSPAIGVDPLAWLAVWQARMAVLPGLEKLAWFDICPEYDPYKYVSFAVNGGHQVYTITRIINERMTRLAASGPLHGFPRTLVFQSVADATVSAPAVVTVFLGRLAPEGHEAVGFDINRRADVEPLLRTGIRIPAERLLGGPALPFGVTLLTNRDVQSSAVVAFRRQAGRSEVLSEETGLAWPASVYSLSHISLPIPPDDPIYGANRPRHDRRIYLGRPELIGELQLLAVPLEALVRLRFNPFYSYLQRRTVQFLRLEEAPRVR
jgi:alpha-beta hydrolase superfamily lysophospholipase